MCPYHFHVVFKKPKIEFPVTSPQLICNNFFMSLEMKEKEHNLEKYDCNLFKEYQALKSVSAAEDFLGTIIKRKKR